MKRLFAFGLVLAAFLGGEPCLAQDPDAAAAPETAAPQDSIVPETATPKAGAGQKKQVAPEVIINNCKRAYAALERENNLLLSKGYAAREGYAEYFYGDYARKRAEVQLASFVWQAHASEILIWVVVIICLSGVAFSGYQLWRATAPGAVGSLPAATPAAGALGDDAAPESGTVAVPPAHPLAADVSLSLTNLRITSSVIGLVVLVISVAYLYLFLKEVYNVKVVHTFEVPASAATEAKQAKTSANEP
jgi:hypothetical protein